MANSVQLLALDDFPLVSPGDDLAALLLDCLGSNQLCLQAGDVLVLAQKIVSKAEGRYVRLADVQPSPAARELARRADADGVRTEGAEPDRPELRIAEHDRVLRAPLEIREAPRVDEVDLRLERALESVGPPQ